MYWKLELVLEIINENTGEVFCSPITQLTTETIIFSAFCETEVQMVVYVHNISDAQSKDITNTLQSCYHQISTQENTERQKFTLNLQKIFMALCLPFYCLLP